ncbi:MAG: hypothetical protein IJX47_01610, partial [Clostridia bacterium]|nr:hypothetical protein [Clostridia bacterium]
FAKQMTEGARVPNASHRPHLCADRLARNGTLRYSVATLLTRPFPTRLVRTITATPKPSP